MSFSSLSHDEAIALRAHMEQDIVIPKPHVRRQLEDDIAAYLARGGVISQAESKQLRCVIPENPGIGPAIRRVWTEKPRDFSFTNFNIGSRAA